MKEIKDILDISEVAQLLNKRPSEIRKMLKAGQIPYFTTLNGHYRIKLSDIIPENSKKKEKKENVKEILTPAEASKLLGVSRPTVTQMAKYGLLPYTDTPGGHHRILREDVERYITQSRIKAKMRAILTAKKLEEKKKIKQNSPTQPTQEEKEERLYQKK